MADLFLLLRGLMAGARCPVEAVNLTPSSVSNTPTNYSAVVYLINVYGPEDYNVIPALLRSFNSTFSPGTNLYLAIRWNA